MTEVIQKLVGELERQAQLTTKIWFENYLKGAIAYRGLKTAQVSEITINWYEKNKLKQKTIDEQLLICDDLAQSSLAEDKFAAFIYINKFLLPKTQAAYLLNFVEKWFQKGVFFDWSTNDWFNIRVLSPILRKANQKEKKRIANWCKSGELWQKRSSIVPFRALVKDQKQHSLIVKIMQQLVDDRQRFVQTGIGWVLSDLSKKYPEVAQNFIEKNFEKLIPEVIRRHTKHCRKHKKYINLLKLKKPDSQFLIPHFYLKSAFHQKRYTKSSKHC